MQGKRVSFNLKSKPEFIRELRAEVDRYFSESGKSKHGNLQLYLKAVFMLSLYLIPFILMMAGWISTPGGVLLAFIIMGTGKAGVGMGVMHDANHGSFSSNHRINRILGSSMYLLGGFPVNWRYQHNVMHHGFTNIDGHDEDIDPGKVMRISPHKPLLKFHRFQHIYGWFLYGLMTVSWVTTKDFDQLKRYRMENVKLNTPYNYRQLFMILVLAKALYYSLFFVLPILLLPVSWYWVILGFFLMHFTSGLILTTVFQTAHVVPSSMYPVPDDQGSLENSWAVHQLYTTSDFSPGSWLVTWYTGGLNYQIEHHLFPNISHVHYPRIARIVRAMAAKHGLPYHVQPGFLSAVVEHARMLKKLGNPAIV